MLSCPGACDKPLLASEIVEVTVSASSSLDADHSVDQLVLGTLPEGFKAGFWQAAQNDGNQWIQVYNLLIIILTLYKC